MSVMHVPNCKALAMILLKIVRIIYTHLHSNDKILTFELTAYPCSYFLYRTDQGNVCFFLKYVIFT